LEFSAFRAVTYHHDSHTFHVGQRFKAFHLFLTCKTAHKPDYGLPVRSEESMQIAASTLGREEFEIHTPRPQVHRLNSVGP
jgi:hypothetical protein